MKTSEAEGQVLASLIEAEKNGEATDRASLDKSGERYWLFREDWSGAFEGLIEKGLLSGNDRAFSLTDLGRPQAESFHAERPDMYWYYYQKFYPAARASQAHSRLCEKVFGKDLCQEGQADMESVEHMLDLLNLKEGHHFLDLGCGAGIIAEYMSDTTGATASGLDYSATAIAEAAQRTKSKSDQISFIQGDMNALDFPGNSFDAVTSLDTLYWVADLSHTMSALAQALRPGGRMALFMNYHSETPDDIKPENTELHKVLIALGLSVETYDYTRQVGEFWRRIYAAAKELKDDFEAEGNGYIAASLIKESEEYYLPDINADNIVRYLYFVQMP